jgi:hypothetical protein
MKRVPPLPHTSPLAGDVEPVLLSDPFLLAAWSCAMFAGHVEWLPWAA